MHSPPTWHWWLWGFGGVFGLLLLTLVVLAIIWLARGLNDRRDNLGL